VITAENITDEQILELSRSAMRMLDDHSLTHLNDEPYLRIRALCMAALRITYTARQCDERAKARARCAEILNARAEASK